MPQNSKKERNEVIRAISFLSQIGFTVTACVLIGVLLGRLLDGFFNTSPWLLLFFAFLGAAAAIKFLFDFAKKT